MTGGVAESPMINDQSPMPLANDRCEIADSQFITLPFGTAWGVEVLLRGAGNCQRIFDEAEELTLRNNLRAEDGVLIALNLLSRRAGVC